MKVPDSVAKSGDSELPSCISLSHSEHLPWFTELLTGCCVYNMLADFVSEVCISNSFFYEFSVPN